MNSDALSEILAALDLIGSPPSPGPVGRERWVRAARSVLSPYLMPHLGADLRWLPWEIALTHPGGHTTIEGLEEALAEGLCVPTTLSVDTRPHGHGEAGPGGLWKRGACLGCTWEGPIHAVGSYRLGDERAAVEDAHDHAIPWWRDLPIVERPHQNNGRYVKKSVEALAEQYEVAIPGCTDHPMCPIRTWRDPGATRHHSDGALGGYDLGTLREQAP